MGAHPIDRAIYTGTLTAAMLREHAALPLPDEGESYWGDAMREVGEPARAARHAAKAMGAAAESIATVASIKMPGRNIGDDERNTSRLTLRLDPDVADRMRAIAAAWKCTLAEVVEEAISRLDPDRR